MKPGNRTIRSAVPIPAEWFILVDKGVLNKPLFRGFLFCV